MTDTRTSCTKCNNSISTRTAEKNDGLCLICVRYLNRAPDPVQAQPLPTDSISFAFKPDTSSLVTGDTVNWKSAEEILVDLASKYLRLFADANSGEQFYAIAFDCNADNGQVFLCANSTRYLGARAAECKAESPHLWDSMSLTELEDHLRWSLGDWEFNAFTTDSFSDAWEPVANILTDTIKWDSENGVEQFRVGFMATACRAMLRLETDGILDLASQTDDFRSFVADHDESDDDSSARYDAIREKQNRG